MWLWFIVLWLLWLFLLAAAKRNILEKKYNYVYDWEIVSIKNPKEVQELAIWDLWVLVTKDYNHKIEKIIPYEFKDNGEIIISIAIDDKLAEIPVVLKKSNRNKVEIVYKAKKMYDPFGEYDYTIEDLKYGIIELTPEYEKLLNTK